VVAVRLIEEWGRFIRRHTALRESEHGQAALTLARA